MVANWTFNSYTVTFDAQGGELRFETINYTYGTNGYPRLPGSFMGVNSSYIPKKEGYKFVCWYRITEFDDEEELWGGEQITYDQTFMLSGQSNAPLHLIYKVGVELIRQLLWQ